ncbi:MAG: DEAD/DEAH box helicase [Crocosphaera sp.]|uniref:DEAD/DEAH box helicase n=1 Tax=Crocosphaera sp. TaxID=2729996 RepID=UPI002588711B|nr:DEAD/DEAH box helicase [Crocosphaera sp.]MCH2247904.1 DEAD/DEAH box helicase [Crocosphaera sp.]
MESIQSTKYQLRDYQTSLIHNIYQEWKNGKTKVIAQLPTGAGKTICFAVIAKEFLLREEKVIVLAHREELVLQAADKLRNVTEQEVGIIKSKYKPNYLLPIQVASVQSLVRRTSMIEKVGLIIIDEAHHSTASTYRKILERYPKAYQLGVTATPIRLDGVGFKDLFDQLVCGATIKELIKQNYLSSFKLYADPHPMKTKGVKIAQGDYSIKGLEEANSIVELSGNLIKSYLKYARGKRCIVFAISVEHSKIIADRYNQAGISAYHLDGKTADLERREAMEKFRKGEFLVLTNCQLFDEGLDIPGLEAVQIAKPTRSLTRWLQMVGRALRPMKNKKYAIILDHTKNWAIHGLPNREREWSLNGVEENEKVEAVKNSLGEIIEQPIIIQETERNLEQIEDIQSENKKNKNNYKFSKADIKNDEDKIWLQRYEALVYEQRVKNHSKGWIFHQLKMMEPPLFIWEEYAKLRDYNLKWANYQFEEQQKSQNKFNLECSSGILSQILWQEFIDQLSLFNQLLIKQNTTLLSFNGKVIKLEVENKTALEILISKNIEIQKLIHDFYQRNILLQLEYKP